MVPRIQDPDQYYRQRNVAFAQQQAALQVSMSLEQFTFGAFNTLHY
jgi:hypothetical protein